MRVVNGVRLAFQAGTEDFDHPSPLQFYLSKALSGCVHGLGPCGPGSNPGRETKFEDGNSKQFIHLTFNQNRKNSILFYMLCYFKG